MLFRSGGHGQMRAAMWRRPEKCGDMTERSRDEDAGEVEGRAFGRGNIRQKSRAR